MSSWRQNLSEILGLLSQSPNALLLCIWTCELMIHGVTSVSPLGSVLPQHYLHDRYIVGTQWIFLEGRRKWPARRLVWLDSGQECRECREWGGASEMRLLYWRGALDTSKPSIKPWSFLSPSGSPHGAGAGMAPNVQCLQDRLYLSRSSKCSSVILNMEMLSWIGENALKNYVLPFKWAKIPWNSESKQIRVEDLQIIA